MSRNPCEPSDAATLRVDGRRLWASLMAMAEVGATPGGGSDRQALTDADRQGRDLFRRWAEQAGCGVTIDEMGNMAALRPGRRPGLAPVAIGSHLDTQPTGGRFDGVLGVLAGLEVVRSLNDARWETERPLLVVNWTNEEGARFAPAMLSSGVWAGAFERDWALARCDREGRRFGDELERIGYRGWLPCRRADWRCHLELHIEQGPVLEHAGRSIGVVTGGQGIRWYNLGLAGQSAHAGSTPMPRRRDALVAAAAIVAGVESIARSHGSDAVATVGDLTVLRASRNVVPGQVQLTIDLRHPDAATLDAMEAALQPMIADACSKGQIVPTLARLWAFPPVRFDPGCMAAIRDAADALELTHRDIISGPGHDSFFTASVVPTAMIFIPCRDGISHNEAEWIEPEQAEAGANVLLHTALSLAQTA